MNENVKKVSIVVIAVIALVVAVWQGYRFAAGPAEIKHEVGHGTPGHGMKAAENAEGAGTPKGGGDPLAGPGG